MTMRTDRNKFKANEKEVKTISLYAVHPSAGFPIPGDDLVEKELNLQDLLVDDPASTFFVRVAGDSMEDARIFDGDILVVDRSIEVSSGLIVVAAVYGELVVKRIQKTTEGLSLVSANEEYKPIQISEAEDCYVWGVVTGCVRTFV